MSESESERIRNLGEQARGLKRDQIAFVLILLLGLILLAAFGFSIGVSHV